MIERSKVIRKYNPNKNFIGIYRPSDWVCLRIQARKSKDLNWIQLCSMLKRTNWHKILNNEDYSSKKGNTLSISFRYKKHL